MEALRELRLAAGTQFDPRVVEAFCQLAAVHPAQLERSASIETQAA
jgi:response regulator RpfG family c-di-GMP phosphodiesterase